MTTPTCTISQKSLTKNFIIQSMERKKIGQIQGRTSMRRLVCNPTIQYTIINLHTKYDYSSLHSLAKISDKNFIIQSMERKKIGQLQGRISRRKLVRNPTLQYTIINLHIKYDYSSSHSLPEIFDEKLHHSKYGKKKKIGQIQGRISRRRLLCNPTIQHVIINLLTKYDWCSLHSFTEIFDEKFHHSKYGKKENWTHTGKNMQEKAGLQSHNTACHHQSVY